MVWFSLLSHLLYFSQFCFPFFQNVPFLNSSLFNSFNFSSYPAYLFSIQRPLHSLSLSLYSTSAPSHHVNYTTVLFLYYSPLCLLCHPHCRARLRYVTSILLGSAVAVEMRRGRVLVPSSTTNGCLASSDWHRLEGSWWWCGGGSRRGPGGFIAAV